MSTPPPPTPPTPPGATPATPVAASKELASTPVASPPPQQTPPKSAAIPAPTQDHFYSRVFAVTVTAVLAFALYEILTPFLGPLMWALFIAFLLYPAHTRLTVRLRNRPNLSAGLLTAAAFIMLIGPLTALSAAFAAQAGDLIDWVQNLVQSQGRERYQRLVDVPLVGPLLNWIRGTFGIRNSQIENLISQGANQIPGMLAGLGGQLFMGALNTLLGFVVMLFMLFFFVRDGHEMVIKARDLIPLEPVRRQQMIDHLASVTRAVVFGTGITILIQGAIVGLAFAVTGLSSPLVFGVLAAFLALLPFGGTAIVWLPALIYLAGNNDWGLATVMLIMGIVSSSIDNVVRPLLISGRAEVGTLAIFIGVLGGAASFGAIGIFLGPVVLALIIALIDFSVELRRSELKKTSKQT
jgi:predicted PurR-regulated permease PerM